MTNDTQQNKKKNVLATLFEDLSLAQVIAGALAAATVFLLSSTIGVAGSLIGAAIGSVVSAVSSQIYKKMLSASADKIRDASPLSEDETPADSSNKTKTVDSTAVNKTHVINTPKATAGATKVMSTNDARYQELLHNNETSADPALQRAHAQRQHKSRLQRNILIVSVLSALITVAVAAGAIHVITAGQGIGAKPNPATPAATESSQTSASSNAEQKATEGNQSENQDTPKNTTNDASTDTNSNKASNDSGSSSDTSEGSSNSNSGSSSDNNSSGNSTSNGQNGSSSSGSQQNASTGNGSSTNSSGNESGSSSS